MASAAPGRRLVAIGAERPAFAAARTRQLRRNVSAARGARLAAGLTIAQAAEAAGYSFDAVRFIEVGRRNPSAAMLARLAVIYGVEPESLR